MRVVILASGSSGNAIYIGSDHTRILVDAGISNKKIEERLNEIGVDMKDLSGICVTHEHLDHIRGLSVLAKFLYTLQKERFRSSRQWER